MLLHVLPSTTLFWFFGYRKEIFITNYRLHQLVFLLYLVFNQRLHRSFRRFCAGIYRLTFLFLQFLLPAHNFFESLIAFHEFHDAIHRGGLLSHCSTLRADCTVGHIIQNILSCDTIHHNSRIITKRKLSNQMIKYLSGWLKSATK
jgi:hypothetical protein